MRKCMKILEFLKKHPCAEPFRFPVDAEALGIPNYYDIIKEPMDLYTIENNLKTKTYTSPV